MKPGLPLIILLLAGACGGSSSPDTGSEPAGLTACEQPSDCVVVPQSCCGSCGAATREDSRAVNVTVAATWRRSNCQDQGCPTCYRPRDPTLVATCESGSCGVVDLHLHPALSCAADDDCRLRTSSCCECTGDATVEGLIAVSEENRYAALVCDRGQACPECAPVYPSEPRAVCRGDHCEVEDPRLP